MKYAIVDLLWAKSHGIEILPEMRTSIDQSKVILHEETLVPFEDESFSDPMWKQGNPVQSVLAQERFKNQLHWTNKVTGETARSETCPGENWIQKRSNFKNAFEGKSMMFDIRTGEKVLVDKSELQTYHCIWNKVIIETESLLIVDVCKHIHDLGLSIGRAEFINYLKGNSIPKSHIHSLAKIDFSGYSITNPKTLTYPHFKEII